MKIREPEGPAISKLHEFNNKVNKGDLNLAVFQLVLEALQSIPNPFVTTNNFVK